MKYSKLILAAALVTLYPVAQAANLDITWGDPKEFRDVRPTNEGKTKFANRVMNELTEQFEKEAAKLPEGQTLHVTVNDLDLAGDIEYFYRGYESGLRVIRRVDVPSMDVSYELKDAADRTIKSGDEHFADLGFNATQLTTRARYDSPFMYERQMIKKWADETL